MGVLVHFVVVVVGGGTFVVGYGRRNSSSRQQNREARRFCSFTDQGAGTSPLHQDYSLPRLVPPQDRTLSLAVSRAASHAVGRRQWPEKTPPNQDYHDYEQRR